jgi:hypothetical protein
MSSTFSPTEQQKPRRLLGAKSLVLSGLAVGALAQQPAQAQYTVNTLPASASLGNNTIQLVSTGNNQAPLNGGNPTTHGLGFNQINLSNAQDLIGVAFSYSGSISQSARLQVAGGASTGSATITMIDTLTLTVNSGLFSTGTTLANSQGSNTASMNGTTGYANSWSWSNVGTASYSANSATDTGLTPRSPSGGLSAFVGGGSLGMTLTLTDHSSETNHSSSSMSNDSAGNYASSSSLTYTYLTGSDTGGLLTNGSFELPHIMDTTANGTGWAVGTSVATIGFATTASSVNALPGMGWTFNGGGVNQNGNNGFTMADAGSGGSDGNQAGFVQQTGNMQQTFTAPTTGFYKISFVAEQRTADSETFQVYINGQVLSSGTNGFNGTIAGGTGYTASSGQIQPTSSTSWNTYTLYSGQLQANTAYTVEFLGTDIYGGDNSFYVDSVHLAYAYSSVPSPSSLLVLGSGLPLMLLRRRQRKAGKAA